MQLIIPINKPSIRSAIEMVTGYIGKNVGQRVDNIMATDDEAALVDQLINASVSSFVSSKRKYSPVYTNEAVTLTMPDNFDVSIKQSVSDAVEQYIINRSLSEWFAIARLPEDAARYMATASEYLADASSLLCSRIKTK